MLFLLDVKKYLRSLESIIEYYRVRLNQSERTYPKEISLKCCNSLSDIMKFACVSFDISIECGKRKSKVSVSRWEALIENHSPCKVVMSVDDNHLKDKSEVSPLQNAYNTAKIVLLAWGVVGGDEFALEKLAWLCQQKFCVTSVIQ